jgi:hypothetical protein
MPLDPPPTRLELVAAGLANATQDATKALRRLAHAMDESYRQRAARVQQEIAARQARFDAVRDEARRVR